jgi:hypothetical protein
MANFEKAKGASYWASYFVNGDASGMDDEEILAADKWLEKHDVAFVVDVEGEPHFSNDYGLLADDRFQGGDLIEYVFEVNADSLLTKGQ